MHVAKVVKSARQKKGLSCRRAALELKFADQYLQRIENGTAPLPLARFKQFVTFYKIDTNILFKAVIDDYAEKCARIIEKSRKV